MGRLTKEEEKRRKQNQWIIESHKRICKVVTFSLHNKKDIDIINQLNKQQNRSGYIKNLIREDMKKNQKGEN